MNATAATYSFHAQTDPGLMRANNEDAYSYDAVAGLAVLADGMGGYNAGEVASSMACQCIREDLSAWLVQAQDAATLEEVRRALEDSVTRANKAVFRAATENAQYAGMGTTLVAGVFYGDTLVLGHIGDSRCYRLREGWLTQITRDHSLLQEQIDAGYMTPEQAAMSINRSLVTRALGVDAAVLLEVHEHAVEPGDLYLLCSDGLSDMLRESEIARILQQPVGLQAQVRNLIAAANARGGRDNITALLVQVAGDERAVTRPGRGWAARWLKR